MSKVNFFLLGAPKSGTTSMANYLSQHPDIFMPHMKEPHFFSQDFPGMQRVHTLEEYEAVYPLREGGYKFYGDASVCYLYSKVAVENILKYNPEARFMVILRKPQAMIPSLHSQLLYSGREEIQDFREAWNARHDRKRGERLPKNVLVPAHLYYDEFCKYGDQIERVLGMVPRERILIMDFDDFKKDAKAATRSVFSFLGVNPDVEIVTEVANQNHRHKFPALAHFMMYPPFPLNLIKRFLKSFMFIRKTAPLRGFYKSITVYGERADIPQDLKQEILDVYLDDIAKLERVTGRQLPHWRKL